MKPRFIRRRWAGLSLTSVPSSMPSLESFVQCIQFFLLIRIQFFFYPGNALSDYCSHLLSGFIKMISGFFLELVHYGFNPGFLISSQIQLPNQALHDGHFQGFRFSGTGTIV